MGRHPNKYHVVYYRWFLICWFPFTIRKSFDSEFDAIKAVRKIGWVPYQIYDQNGNVVDKRDKSDFE